MQNLCTGKKHFCLPVAIINSPKSLITKRKRRVSVVELHWRSQCFSTLLKKWPWSLLLPTGSCYPLFHFVLFVSFFWLICSTSIVELSRKFVLSLLWAPRTSRYKKNDASYNCPVVVSRKLHVNNSVPVCFAFSSDSVVPFFYPTDKPLKYERRHLVNHTPALLQLWTTLLLFYVFR